jgi:glucose-1-phosphate thymidylyltransferase
MRGIILAGGTGSRLHPMTRAMNKQLLPIFNKPMIYYPLTTLMLSGCREILVIVSPSDINAYHRLLDDGAQWGLNINYAKQATPGGIAEAFLIGRKFIGQSRVSLILGDNVFFGSNLRGELEKGTKASNASIFAYWVSTPSAYGVVEFDAEHRPLRIIEKPDHPRSSWAVTGLYFYNADVSDVATSLTRSARGKLEITDINNHYLFTGTLDVHRLGRGHAWLDTGTPANLLRAAQFVEITEERQGLQIGSPEEVAWRMRYIDDACLESLIHPVKDTEYGLYLKRLLDRV